MEPSNKGSDKGQGKPLKIKEEFGQEDNNAKMRKTIRPLNPGEAMQIRRQRKRQMGEETSKLASDLIKIAQGVYSRQLNVHKGGRSGSPQPGVEDESEISTNKGQTMSIIRQLKQIIRKVRRDDKTGAVEALHLANKELQSWVKDDPRSVDTQTTDDKLGDHEDPSKFKTGDWVTIGELVPILERDDEHKEDAAPDEAIPSKKGDTSVTKFPLRYNEALYVRRGYLMSRDWAKVKPPTAKRANKEASKKVPLVEEWNFEPHGTYLQGEKAMVGVIPHWKKQRGLLRGYRMAAEELMAKPDMVTKEDFEAEGAHLRPIMEGGCVGDKESGDFLWA